MSLVLLGILNSQAAGAGGAGAYDLLETQVLASSASSVTFTGLGSYSDYKHLQLRVTARGDSGSVPNQWLEFNGDTTSSNYKYHALTGSGSSVISFSGSPMFLHELPNPGETSGIYASKVIDILDFSSTTKNTTVGTAVGINASFNRITLTSGLWINTNAVTSINTYPSSGNFITGSRFSLYGVKA